MSNENKVVLPEPDLHIENDMDADAPYRAYSVGLFESTMRALLATATGQNREASQITYPQGLPMHAYCLAPRAQADARDADTPMLNMTPPATSRDRWMYQQGRLAEREEICAAIKAEDDHCVTQGDYMLDSDDCIKVARGEWVRPVYDAAIAAAKGSGNA